jgi:hypothetical protein
MIAGLNHWYLHIQELLGCAHMEDSEMGKRVCSKPWAIFSVPCLITYGLHFQSNEVKAFYAGPIISTDPAEMKPLIPIPQHLKCKECWKEYISIMVFFVCLSHQAMSSERVGFSVFSCLYSQNPIQGLVYSAAINMGV